MLVPGSWMAFAGHLLGSRTREWASRLRGKRVRLTIDDTPDHSLFLRTFEGTIESVTEGVLTIGPQGSTRLRDACAVVRLDTAHPFSDKDVTKVAVLPKLEGYRLWALWFTSIPVSVSPVRKEPVQEVFWEDVLCLASMRNA